MIHDGRVIINRFVGNCGNLIGIIERRSSKSAIQTSGASTESRFDYRHCSWQISPASRRGSRLLTNRLAAAVAISILSSSDFVVVYSSMALFQIEPELDSTGGLDVAMFAQGADEFITGSSATVFA